MMLTSARFLAGGLLACGLVSAVVFTARMTRSLPSDKSNPSKASGTPVVVELFTSEGCSSCPSADKVLADLKRTQPVNGARIIVLGEHVDYWNNMGWRDPFSNSAFTSRQYEYGRKFRLDSVYTPQAVVDGQAELVGSERDQLEGVVGKSAKSVKADVEVTPEPNAPDKVHIVVKQTPLNDADVMLAVTEDELSSSVSRGENSGRTLTHVGVVRTLRKIGSTSGKSPFATSASLDLQSGWKRPNLEAIVFVQERGSRRIVGANTCKISAK